MKNISILVISFLLVGCVLSPLVPFPKPPVLDYHYTIEVRGVESISENEAIAYAETDKLVWSENEIVRCVKFKVVQAIPYKIELIGQVPLKECNHIGGFKPEKIKEVANWGVDVNAWAKDHKFCFKGKEKP